MGAQRHLTIALFHTGGGKLHAAQQLTQLCQTAPPNTTKSVLPKDQLMETSSLVVCRPPNYHLN